MDDITKGLTDDEVRALFEDSFTKAAPASPPVPREVFYATLKDMLETPEREHLLPFVLALFKKFYIEPHLFLVGATAWKIDHKDESLVEGRDRSTSLESPHILVRGMLSQKDKVNDNQFVFV